jgi:hypothetical protein
MKTALEALVGPGAKSLSSQTVADWKQGGGRRNMAPGNNDALRNPSGRLPQVLMVSNHWEAQEKILPFAGVFVDSQISSCCHLFLWP